MHTTPLRLLPAAVLAALLVLPGCRRDEPVDPSARTSPPASAPAPAPAPASPTASVTAIDVGTAVDASGRVVANQSEFARTDGISTTVLTNTSSPDARVPADVTVRWTFEDGQVVSEETRRIDFAGPGVTSFRMDKPDGWPLGRYRLEVLLDGQVVQTREVTVR